MMQNMLDPRTQKELQSLGYYEEMELEEERELISIAEEDPVPKFQVKTPFIRKEQRFWKAGGQFHAMEDMEPSFLKTAHRHCDTKTSLIEKEITKLNNHRKLLALKKDQLEEVAEERGIDLSKGAVHEH